MLIIIEVSRDKPLLDRQPYLDWTNKMSILSQHKIFLHLIFLSKVMAKISDNSLYPQYKSNQ
jgi:hypothetical protein